MEKETSAPFHLIVKTLKEKSVVKQDVYTRTRAVFQEFRITVKEIVEELKQEMVSVDKRIQIESREKGDFEIELHIAGDVLIFYMHTNVFEFDRSHSIWRTSYIRENELNSYCGMINVYNFLADSFKYHRFNDIGYLIARMFINRELHYFVEGKRQLGFLYNDFVHAVVDKTAIKAIIESAILYCINFDLFTPPFESVKEVSVREIEEASIHSSSMQIQTGKRLGFRFQADTDQID